MTYLGDEESVYLVRKQKPFPTKTSPIRKMNLAHLQKSLQHFEVVTSKYSLSDEWSCDICGINGTCECYSAVQLD